VTDTDDGEGEVIDTRGTTHVDERMVREAAARFTGALRQRPPRYSALKIKGKRASDLAREGSEVNLAERAVTIRSLEVLEVDLDNSSLVVDVCCSKGTYIRSLARDLGEALGTGAHMAGLRRTESGRFRIGDAVTIDDLRSILAGERGEDRCAISPFEALEDFGVITVVESAKRKVLNGAMFDREEVIEIVRGQAPRFRVADEGKNLFAIAEADIDNWKVHYLNVFNAQSH
jgi:tRNA pseudouridine55 synthase